MALLSTCWLSCQPRRLDTNRWWSAPRRRHVLYTVRAMEINEGAPAVARGEIEVAASPEFVWSVLTDIANWPSWNPDVKVRVDRGPGCAAGTEFRWKAGPGTINSAFQTVEPLTASTGRERRSASRRSTSIDSNSRTARRSLDRRSHGMASSVRLLRRSMAKSLQKAIDSGLQHLKIEAERQAPEHRRHVEAS